MTCNRGKLLQVFVRHSGFNFLSLYHLFFASLITLLCVLPQHLFFVLLQCVNLFDCFVMTLSSLLLEVEHPVRKFAARSAHHIDNGSELPGIIFSVESDGLTCSKARTATLVEGLSNGLMKTKIQTSSELLI